MKTHSETKPCLDCQTPISTAPFTLDWFGTPKTYPAPDICDECGNRRTAERERLERLEKLNAGWEKIAPPIYRSSDITRFPQPLQDALAEFDPATTTGIGIRGPSGTCKTRASFQFLKTAFFAGYSVEATTATKLAAVAAGQWNDKPDMTNWNLLYDTPTIGESNQKKLKRFAECRWLLIDDIGKEKPTDRNEVELYELLETRTSHNLPTIWTLNMSAADLKRRQSKDRSTPILRRLVEFSEVIILE